MKIRPTSITVVGWVLIVMALIIVPNSISRNDSQRAQALVEQNLVPPAIQRAMNIACIAVSLVCGYFILQGANWARWSYLIWIPIQLVYSYLAQPYKPFVLPGIVFSLVVAYLLLRSQASEFFADDGAGNQIQNRLTKRRIVGIVCYILAGFGFASCSLPSMFVPNDNLALTFFMYGMISAIPLMLLIVGRLLSPDSNGPREIGIVLLISAAAAALLVIGLSGVFSRPEFLQTFPPGRPIPEFHYKPPAIWIGLLAAIGGTAFVLGGRVDNANDTGTTTKKTLSSHSEIGCRDLFSSGDTC